MSGMERRGDSGLYLRQGNIKGEPSNAKDASPPPPSKKRLKRASNELWIKIKKM
jgi:hypothetical protein